MGGHVPSSFYMDDATIAANGRAISFAGGIYAGIGSGFFSKVKAFLGIK